LVLYRVPRLQAHLKSTLVDTKTMVRYVRQLLTGLTTLHKAGIVHRNITPKALYVTSTRQARLGDYKCLKVPEDPEYVDSADPAPVVDALTRAVDVSQAEPHSGRLRRCDGAGSRACRRKSVALASSLALS
jgi:serine/threonine protein kinase